MPVSFRCRCGWRARGAEADDEMVECPLCRRSVLAARPRRDRRELWLALGTALAHLAIAGLGVLVVAHGKSCKASRDDIVQAKEPPVPRAVALEPKWVPPVNRVPDLADESDGFDPLPEAAPVAPAPRLIAPPLPAVSALPETKRVGDLDTVFIEPAGRYKVGSTFGQEVVISRRSAFRVAGMDFTQGSQYAFASSFVVTKVNRDGSFVAEQTVVNAKLLDADPDVREPLAAALEKAKGTKFELTITSMGVVMDLKGLKDPIQVLSGKNAAIGDSLRVWSLLDADAWKELAGLTFFQPDVPLKPGATWNRGEAHDWGPLGSWRGKTVFTAAGKQKSGAERVDYRHEVYYRPPAPGAGGNLPFQVTKADFKIVTAGGSILYDPMARRATAVEEAFRVRGAVQVSLGGIDAAIEMEELQGYKLTVTEQVPQLLIGSGPNWPK